MSMETRVTYSELDEIAAPEDLPKVGVKAGDRGVVVMDYSDDPTPAIEVEYAESEAGGATKALVVYSPDLSKVLGVEPEPPLT